MRVEWNGAQILAMVREGEVEGLTLAAEHLLQVSDGRVPLEEGTLARSGAATVDEADRVAAVSYDTPYAVDQHEDLTYRHDPGRQAKYLEQSFTEESGVMGDLVAAAVRRRMTR